MKGIKLSLEKTGKKGLLIVALEIVLATLVGAVFGYFGLKPVSPLLVYILGLIIVATKTSGYFYTSLAGLLTIIVFNYLYLEPYYSIAFSSRYISLFILIMIIAVALAALTENIRLSNYEMMKAEKEKLRIEAELEKESFQAGVLRAMSHDIRTPLAGITGSAEILLNVSESISEEKRREIYEYISEETAWLTDLVDNLLSLSKMTNGREAIKPQAEMLAEVVEEALKHVDRKKVNYNLVTDFEDELLMAMVDARLLAQVIINLVNNAIRYTADGTTITVGTRAAGDMVELFVSDNGCGISDEIKTVIFDKFFTTGKLKGDSRRGMGIGLSVCKSVVEAHGGSIRIEDNEPSGSIFVCSLPAAELKLLGDN